jgi:Spy/CpxP family protein refolding chaperone
MTNSYGPWATLIDTGRSPQLSAFWRQRLSMLVPISQTRAALSMRNVVLLVAGALLICILPTFRAAPAVADQEKTSQEKGKDRAVNAIAKKPATTASSENIIGGTSTVTDGGPLLPEPMMSRSHPNDLDFPFYQPLLTPGTRAELHLSAEQEQKLHELNRKYLTELRPKERKLSQELDKATADSLPEEKNRKMDEMWIKIHKMAKPVRQQVEALLTPEQLAKLRKLALIDRRSAAILVYDLNDPKTRARLTQEQKKEIEHLCLLEQQFTTKAYDKIVQADRENDEKALAILSPPQREQIERQIREGEAGMPIIFGQQLSFQFTTPPGVAHVSYPSLWEFSKELGLNPQQISKLEATELNSQASRKLLELFKQPPEIPSRPVNGATAGKQAKKGEVSGSGNTYAGGTLIISDGAFTYNSANVLPRLSPQLEEAMGQPEFRQKVEDLKKEFRQQMEAELTPQQVATLKKLALQKAIARRVRDSEIPADLHLTEQQKAEIYGLEFHADTMHRLFLEGKEMFVDALSPQQRQKCFEEMERQEWSCW